GTRAVERRQARRGKADRHHERQDGVVDSDRGPPVTLYLDTSSLVKLYVSEPGSETVRQLVRDATVVATSVVAYPETRAAFARLRHERRLSVRTAAAARRQFD